MDELFNSLRKFGKIDDDIKAHLYNDVTDRSDLPDFKLVKYGDVNRHVYYIVSGLLYVRRREKEKERVTYILDRGDFVVAPSSFFDGTPSQEEIIVVEPTELLYFSKQQLDETCVKFPGFGDIRNAINAFYRVKQESWLTGMLTTTGEERFAELWKNRPDLFNRLPQDILCSYLGIDRKKLYDLMRNRRR